MEFITNFIFYPGEKGKNNLSKALLRLNTRKQSTDKGNIVGVQVKQSTFSSICGDRSLRSSSLRKMGTTKWTRG